MTKIKIILKIICLLFVFFVANNSFAAEYCEYVNGSEGIKLATVPPPGVYYRFYDIFYNSHELTGRRGEALDIDYSIQDYAIFHRYFWVSEKKVLGGNYMINLVIPLAHRVIKIEASGVDEDTSGLADILFEPFILGWHGQRYDAVIGIGGFLPSGKYEKGKLSSLGKNYWTGEVGLGGTYYFDAKKTWTFSILARREFHGKKLDENLRAGNDFHFEWGAGKTVMAGSYIWDIGACGYCQWQVTDDRGTDLTYDGTTRDRVLAAGPEIMFYIIPKQLSFSLKTLWQFKARDRAEGFMSNLAICKKF